MRVLLGAAFAAALAGCASITDGTSQTLIFKMEPLASRCTLVRDGVELGAVTGKLNTINISKGAKDIVVACSADGFEPKTLRLVSSTQAAGVVGGLLLDFGITDMLTGAMWKYQGDVNVVLEPTKTAATGTTPAAAATPAPAAAAPAPAPAASASI